jgi:hypothetical protein
LLVRQKERARDRLASTRRLSCVDGLLRSEKRPPDCAAASKH